ncbi:MAG: HAD family hydrolase [Anaerolineae bacterium]|nr:HAD family hydrolase [Anaerolineae bacterium]
MAIHLDIPGRESLRLEHLVLDLNGTVALDGEVLPGVVERLAALSSSLAIHLVTADTHGRAVEIGAQVSVQVLRIQARDEADQKQALVERLGAERVMAIGNGANDAAMLARAAVGIAVLGPEGLATVTLRAADMVVGRIEDALDLLLRPQRLVAALRH